VTVSKTLAERVAQSFHVLLNSLQSLGIPVRKSLSYSESGYFERARDRPYLTITEDLVGPDGSRFYSPTYQWPREKTKPSGYLTFSIDSSRYGPRDTKQWSESAKLPLDRLLAQLVIAIASTL
jgi:hypothetical protein